MSEILCSTGAIIGKANNRDYHLLSKYEKELNCDGFEFMMYSSWYDEKEEIIDFIQNANLHIPVMHCEKHIGESISKGTDEDIKEAVRLFEINCDMAGRIKADKMVLHLWDGITSDCNFENNFNTYKILDKTAKRNKVNLLVENVVCNQENPMKRWCELVQAYPQIHFVFDTKMAAFHMQEHLLYEKDYEWLWKDNHIQHYHINDYNGGYMEWDKLRTLPIGSGHIDFDKFFSFINKIAYDGTFTVEATAFNNEGIVDVNMLNNCFEAIREKLLIS